LAVRTAEPDADLEAALADFRRARRRKRVADVHWIDALYQAYLTALIGGAAVPCRAREPSAQGTKTSWAMVMRQKADVQPGTADQRTNSADQPMANTPSARTRYALAWLMCSREGAWTFVMRAFESGA